MIRTAARKTLLLAAATLSLGALAVNCSHNNSPSSNSDLGSVGLAISLPGGATVSTVHYSVRNSSGTEVRFGDIATTDPGATVSVVIGGVPAGTGYTVILTATASDGSSCAGTSLPFAVTANMSTTVNVLLLCRGVVTNGTVSVNGAIDNCPSITSYVVSPLAVAPGGSINVNAAAADLDSSDVVTFRWTASAGTATAGTFDTATSAMTVFHCPATGSSQQTLTVTASDNLVPGTTAPKCSTPASIVVSCGLCGNGTVDTGEACDPAATPTGAPANFACNSSCQVVAVCGNSVVQTGEQCDPPNGTTCDQSCQLIPVVCGNAIVQPGEQCDPPGPITGTSNTCSSTCQIVTAGAGGAGGRGGSSGAGGAGGAGGSSGGSLPNAACRACEAANCDPTFQGCSMFTGADLAACKAVETCIRTNHCDKNGNTQACYCGTKSDSACLVGTGNGVCKALMETADAAHLVGLTDPADIAGVIAADLVDGSTPMGGADNLIGCDAFSCAAANQCGPSGPTGQF